MVGEHLLGTEKGSGVGKTYIGIGSIESIHPKTSSTLISSHVRNPRRPARRRPKAGRANCREESHCRAGNETRPRLLTRPLRQRLSPLYSRPLLLLQSQQGHRPGRFQGAPQDPRITQIRRSVKPQFKVKPCYFRYR
ncbi:hypothetical protein L596_009628 [Steinernema carpocapsae]|uniref:Uncharacterized protein n=1 Tax=Steinernema carpocapsae TaxID=34508 RepID=A0A4U5PFX5_STECR|nr:hypothetical protein L596_009628 [Steinernema carpocapsae]